MSCHVDIRGRPRAGGVYRVYRGRGTVRHCRTVGELRGIDAGTRLFRGYSPVWAYPAGRLSSVEEYHITTGMGGEPEFRRRAAEGKVSGAIGEDEQDEKRGG